MRSSNGYVGQTTLIYPDQTLSRVFARRRGIANIQTVPARGTTRMAVSCIGVQLSDITWTRPASHRGWDRGTSPVNDLPFLSSYLDSAWHHRRLLIAQPK